MGEGNSNRLYSWAKPPPQRSESPWSVLYVQAALGRVIGIVAVPLLAGLVAASLISATAGADSQKGNGSGKGSALLAAPSVPVHGVADDGTEFDGSFTLKEFQTKKGVLYAVGRLTGDLGERNVNNKRVMLPVTGAVSEQNPPADLAAQQIVPTPGACDILTLALGPIDLDLLGLRVALDEVNLLIEAIPGAGNLLGNLLCAVAGLLDPGPIGLPGLVQGLLDSITNLLNGLLGGLLGGL